MNDPSHDAGVLHALVKRLNEQRLPRLLDIRARVDQGETLSDDDLDFLKHATRDASSIEPLVDRHPEYQQLAANVIQLYKHITDKALENERKT